VGISESLIDRAQPQIGFRVLGIQFVKLLPGLLRRSIGFQVDLRAPTSRKPSDAQKMNSSPVERICPLVNLLQRSDVSTASLSRLEWERKMRITDSLNQLSAAQGSQ
jgi:hypothetical protein